MTRIVLVSLVIFLNGCATAEMGRLITPEQAAWIQKGVTTRNEVVERFGVPDLEFPDYTDSKHQPTSTSTTTKEGHTGGTTTPTQVDSPKGTRATYLHTKSEARRLSYRSMRTRNLHRASFGSSMTILALCRILALMEDLAFQCANAGKEKRSWNYFPTHGISALISDMETAEQRARSRWCRMRPIWGGQIGNVG